jgi:hypothetical protein
MQLDHPHTPVMTPKEEQLGKERRTTYPTNTAKSKTVRCGSALLATNP